MTERELSMRAENMVFNIPLSPKRVWISARKLAADAEAQAVLAFAERSDWVKVERIKGKVFIERWGWGHCKPCAADFD